MEFKLIYLFNGTPLLLESSYEGLFTYPEEDWTEVEPPHGLYEPIYFNGSEWIGTDYDVWKAANEIEIEDTELEYEDDLDLIDMKDEMIAELSMQLLAMEDKFQELSNDVAELTMNFMEVGFDA